MSEVQGLPIGGPADLADVRRFGRIALLVGVFASAWCLLGALTQREAFLRSYLFAYLFWLGLSLGSLLILMLYHLTGGAWGYVIRRILESGTRTMPLITILFLPVLFGIKHLYEWAANPAILTPHKKQWLTIPAFTTRAIVCFAFWLLFALIMDWYSRRHDRTGELETSRPLQKISGVGIFVWGLSITIMSFDWVLSLDTRWYSTIYGMVFMIGETLSTFALAIVVLAAIRDRGRLKDAVTADHFNDLGNMLFGFVILWAYLSFAQFLITWNGDQHEEITWYATRTDGGWKLVAQALMALHFFVPFFLLLMRGFKRNPKFLAAIALGVMAMRMVDIYWYVKPSFPEGQRVSWMDLAAPLAIGGLWVSWFLWQLARRPLLPPRNPELEGARGSHHHA